MKKLFFIVFASALIGLGFFAFALAQEASTSSTAISYPIPELGNCANKGECRAYCSNPSNAEACMAFAEKNGLVNSEEAARTRNLAKKFIGTGGPGGCRGPADCKNFCNSVSNLEQCVKFAEEQKLGTGEAQFGRKILDYIKSGGKLPGGCDSKESCTNYCRDFSHAEECFAFAEKTGMGPAAAPGQIGRPEGMPRPEEVRNLIQAVKQGQTPGNCANKEECESYCSKEENRLECLEFGKKVGFLNDEQVSKLKQGIKGPGGCDSKEACKTYCEIPGNQEECYRFGKENGLIKAERLENAQNGLLQMRAGLEKAPPAVVSCIKSVTGENIIADIQSGKLVPGPEIGDRVKECFEKFKADMRPKAAFMNLNPAMQACLKEKLGNDLQQITSGALKPTPEMADAIRICTEKIRLQNPAATGTVNFLKNAPPAVMECLKSKMGDSLEKLRSGEAQMTAEIKQQISGCFTDFRPKEAINALPPAFLRDIPASVAQCLKEKLGAEKYERAERGDASVGEEVKARVQECVRQGKPTINPVAPFVSGTAPRVPIKPPLPGGTIPPTATSSNFGGNIFGIFMRIFR